MYTLIDSINDLSILNEELLTKTCIGIDTEFRRTNKFNMKLALLQVNDDEEIYLIDTMIIEDLNEQASFLKSDKVIKVLHSCKEDIEAIFTWTGEQICNVFDTQIANSFLGYEHSISYQNLVKEKFDVSLEKKETRSNWIRRPLTESQLKYATLDVEYLIRIYEIQRDLLNRQNKLSWHNEEIKKLIKETLNPIEHIAYPRFLSKSQEEELLKNFNRIVHEIAVKENINETLLFSKKSQKDFVRLLYNVGEDKAFATITLWRKNLIQEKLVEIII